MTCNRQMIYIYRGDDTDWNNEQFVTVNITSGSSSIDLSTMSAVFKLGNFTQTYSLAEGSFQVQLSSEITRQFPYGPLMGSIRILDSQHRIKTATTDIPFYVTSEVITFQNQDLVIEVPGVSINVTVGGKVDYNDLLNKPSINGVTVEGSNTAEHYNLANKTDLDAHITDKNNPHEVTKEQIGLGNVDNTSDLNKPISTAVQNALNTKQDIISDLATIRNGATLGTTAVQPATMQAALATKQDNLSESQLAAVNSGITGTGVAQISNNATEINSIESKIPSQASASNQLADKNFVNSSIATNTANFIGTFESISALESYNGTVTNNDYAFVINRVVTDNGNDWTNVNDLNSYDKTLLTNLDYAWVINGSKFDLYRFDIMLQVWDLKAENIHKADVSLNTAYNRYKATVDNLVTWVYEYTLNNSSFTASQWAAINSGATAENITQISVNTTAIAGKQDIISDLDSIRSGAALGATSVQPADLANYATTSDLAARAHQADGVTIIDSGSAISTVAVREQNADVAVKPWVGTKEQYDALPNKDDNTLYFIPDDNQQQASGGTDLTEVEGYVTTSPCQLLRNVNGTIKWQTKEFWLSNFSSSSYVEVRFDQSLPNAAFDCIMQLAIGNPNDSNVTQCFFVNYTTHSNLFYLGDQLGMWDELGSQRVTFNDTLNPGEGVVSNKFIRFVGDNNSNKLYTLTGDNYTMYNLPDLSAWNDCGTTPMTFVNCKFELGTASIYYPKYTVFKNLLIKSNGNVYFDLRNDTGFRIVSSGIKKTEEWV